MSKLILVFCFFPLIQFFVIAQEPGNASACASLKSQIERNYDRFKDQTTTTLKPVKVLQVSNPREELELSVEAITKGQQQEQPKEVALLFSSEAEKWRYFEKAETSFIVDGKRVDAGTAYATDTLPGARTIKEHLKLALPFAKFAEVVKGKQVEMKLGPTQVQFAEKDLTTMRAFLSCVTGK